MRVRLTILRGKQRGQSLDFPPGDFVIGWGPECRVRLASALISRQHCLLVVRESGAVLRDLGSANGTLVNGERFVHERRLLSGDNIELGPLAFQVDVREKP